MQRIEEVPSDVPPASSLTHAHDELTEKDYSYSLVPAYGGQSRQELGRGSYSIVYHGTMSDGKSVALKKSRMPYFNYKNEYDYTLERILNAFKSERIILRLIEESRKVAGIDDQAYFNCLIRYYGSHTFSEDSIQKNVFVFEFANQNNLSEWIDKKDFTWLMRLNVSHQVTMGLIALHEKCQYPIVHGDLKTSNILLHQDNGNLFAKIGDFGFSGICDDTTINRYYSPLYAEPQILLEDCPFNTKGDIWSMGVMLYELFAQQQSYSGHKLYNFDRLVAWVVTNKQINQISTPDLYEKQAQAQVSKALAHVKKLESNLELESSSNSKTSDSLNEARLRLQETKDAVEEAKNRAKKMNSIIKSCCMFYRKDRPTATELKTQLNEIRQPSIKNTN